MCKSSAYRTDISKTVISVALPISSSIESVFRSYNSTTSDSNIEPYEKD